MAYKVFTKVECEQCLSVATFDEDCAGQVPMSWSRVHIERATKPFGLENSYSVFALLCPVCTMQHLTLLEENK